MRRAAYPSAEAQAAQNRARFMIAGTLNSTPISAPAPIRRAAGSAMLLRAAAFLLVFGAGVLFAFVLLSRERDDIIPADDPTAEVLLTETAEAAHTPSPPVTSTSSPSATSSPSPTVTATPTASVTSTASATLTVTSLPPEFTSQSVQPTLAATNAPATAPSAINPPPPPTDDDDDDD
jgi:cytoskeletal protein RodZ